MQHWYKVARERSEQSEQLHLPLDTPEINRIVDMIAENVQEYVRRSLALDADGIRFGDDFWHPKCPDHFA